MPWPAPTGPGVFSAHAEVVPPVVKNAGSHSSILRARGGSSDFGDAFQVEILYSPRTRR